ncbi:MAG TPA: transporter [Myxococcota bacterium]|nr:transporter [Myxococcota bacterium]
MSAPALAVGSRTPRQRLAQWLLWVALPLTALGYQVASKLVADALLGQDWSWLLLARALAMPTLWTAVLCELVGLGAWMVILSEISLSAAFSISALSYVLVIAASWSVFRESISALQLAGGAAILFGVWLIGRAPDER